MTQPEFDRHSESYEELLKDPIRERFVAGDSQFFQQRKCDLIRDHFRAMQIDSRGLRYLDVGCGKGELPCLLRNDFAYVAGCDPSPGMLSFAAKIETRVQDHPEKIPFDDHQFDFVTAVCVYHHVPPVARPALTAEISRILKPGGIFAMIEHNPYNPLTRRIVSRTPVDADAILLKAGEAGEYLRKAGFAVRPPQYFLYFPEPVYRAGGRLAEQLLRRLPLGGQYAIFATRQHRHLTVYD